MKLSEFKSTLHDISELNFYLPNGEMVPVHFHLTELGVTTKSFVDCGGKLREQQNITLQFWQAQDVDHRLSPNKLIKIIEKAESMLPVTDEELQVEYQGNTVEIYGLEYKNRSFNLTATHTDCLAKESCGIPLKKNVSLKSLTPVADSCCTPGGGCC